MTRKEAMRQTHQANTLTALGFTPEEAESLRRISMTLHRWHERECGTDWGCIERDEATGKPYWRNSRTVGRTSIPDREAGAKKRLAAILKARNGRLQYSPNDVSAFIQTDPRGAALYIIRPGDVPEGGDVSAHYSRGICVY